MAKQRQQRMQYQQGGLAAIPHLEGRTDEQLLSESKHRAAARAILGARAAERYDAPTARRFYNEAMVGAHPQERPALRNMMKASLALAERRPDELRDAVEKLGQAPPSARQLLLLRVMGLVAPPPGSSLALRARGWLILVAIAVGLVALGYGLAELIFLPFGGIGLLGGLLVAMLIVILALGTMALLGRRRQSRARARAAGPPAASGAAQGTGSARGLGRGERAKAGESGSAASTGRGRAGDGARAPAGGRRRGR